MGITFDTQLEPAVKSKMFIISIFLVPQNDFITTKDFKHSSRFHTCSGDPVLSYTYGDESWTRMRAFFVGINTYGGLFCQQGFAFFLFYVVLNPQVRQLVLAAWELKESSVTPFDEHEAIEIEEEDKVNYYAIIRIKYQPGVSLDASTRNIQK